MAHQQKHALYSVFGFVVWGDLGPITMYRDQRGRIVAFPKTWPKKPPSPKQVAQRARFTAASSAWQQLSPNRRAAWTLAARRASLAMHGYDLFVHWHTMQADENIRTLERQTGVTLLT